MDSKYLDILFLVGSRCDEIHLRIANLANRYIIAPAKQFKVNNILDGVTAVLITKAQQIIAKADVNDIVFSECTEVGLAFDVKSLDLIEKVALQKRVHICLHRMGAGCAFALAVIQESFVDQRIADGGDRNTGADIIGKEQDDLPQQRRVCDLLLPSAFSLSRISRMTTVE